MSNHNKMKEKLQKKRKCFRVLCTCFFEQEDIHLKDPYVSSGSWKKRKKLFNYYDNIILPEIIENLL